MGADMYLNPPLPDPLWKQVKELEDNLDAAIYRENALIQKLAVAKAEIERLSIIVAKFAD